MSADIWQIGMTIADAEKIIIQKAMSFYQGNKTQAARSLGIAIRTLDNKLKSYETKGQKSEEGTNVD